jgi:hypothetical protein
VSTTLRVIDPFVVGLQLGRVQSPAALAIIERTPGALEASPVTHELGHLQRWPVGTPYPRIIHELTEILRTPLPILQANRDALGNVLPRDLGGQTAALVVNATGVGRAALELLRDEAPDVRRVATWVTTGDQALEETEGWRVPQRDLVAAVQVLEQQNRLEMAEDLADYPELRQQMDAFKVVPGVAGRDRYDPTAGDDLVVALALACWWGELVSPGRVELIPGEFSAFSKEALDYEREKRRVKGWPVDASGPMADGV